MRLIDADALKAYIDEQKGRPFIGCTIGEALKIMTDEQPTIEPERKKGKWDFEEYPDGYYHSECSICGSWFKEDAFLNPYNFCPNCGADMRERSEDVH